MVSVPRPAPSEDDPLSWLYLNPAPPRVDGFAFGVLRRTYKGCTNSAAAFGHFKLYPVPSADGRPTAKRHEVLLPNNAADDALLDPDAFLRAADALAVQPSLLVYVTVPLPGLRPHVAWERLRAFTLRLARERVLAVLAVLHVPGRAGSSNPTHGHLLIGPRSLESGTVALGAYDEDLIRDTGQALIEAMWLEQAAGGAG